jgi:hypothetical protein
LRAGVAKQFFAYEPIVQDDVSLLNAPHRFNRNKFGIAWTCSNNIDHSCRYISHKLLLPALFAAFCSVVIRVFFEAILP